MEKRVCAEPRGPPASGSLRRLVPEQEDVLRGKLLPVANEPPSTDPVEPPAEDRTPPRGPAAHSGAHPWASHTAAAAVPPGRTQVPAAGGQRRVEASEGRSTRGHLPQRGGGDPSGGPRLDLAPRSRPVAPDLALRVALLRARRRARPRRRRRARHRLPGPGDRLVHVARIPGPAHLAEMPARPACVRQPAEPFCCWPSGLRGARNTARNWAGAAAYF
mmetsp:Transcript_14934/g.48215  ORF Transcript_14934/g.48215 Transcript_14934/m.48215 type:complete len:218 (+) Transcript_14934:347-1000(+)